MVSDHLRDNQICIVNMHGLEMPLAQRIADYLGGVSYALNGQVERIDDFIFILAPEKDTIVTDLMSEISSDGNFLKRHVASRR